MGRKQTNTLCNGGRRRGKYWGAQRGLHVEILTLFYFVVYTRKDVEIK